MATALTQPGDVAETHGGGPILSALNPSDIHVLLVDDERLTRLVVGNLLRTCKYKVTIAESGTQALEVLSKAGPGAFQLILTDVMMPDVGGLELLRFVRNHQHLHNVPVIMMSASEAQETMCAALLGSADEYLVKPVTRKEVANIWMHVMKRYHHAAAAHPAPTAAEAPQDAAAALPQPAAALPGPMGTPLPNSENPPAGSTPTPITASAPASGRGALYSLGLGAAHGLPPQVAEDMLRAAALAASTLAAAATGASGGGSSGSGGVEGVGLQQQQPLPQPSLPLLSSGVVRNRAVVVFTEGVAAAAVAAAAGCHPHQHGAAVVAGSEPVAAAGAAGCGAVGSGGGGGGRAGVVRVNLLKWLRRPSRGVAPRESFRIFCEVLLLLDSCQAPRGYGGACRLRPSKLVLYSNGKVAFITALQAPSVAGVAACSGGRGSEDRKKRRRATSGTSEQIAAGAVAATGEGTLPVGRCSAGADTGTGCGGDVTAQAPRHYAAEGAETAIAREGGSGPQASAPGGQPTPILQQKGLEQGYTGTSAAAVGAGTVATVSGGGGATHVGPLAVAACSGGDGGGGGGNHPGTATAVATAPGLGGGVLGEEEEEALYRSPEEEAGAMAGPASDMFSLGLLFFELFYPCAAGNRPALLRDARQRLLPPSFSRQQPKEAAFACALLHPDPACRPTLAELLGSAMFRATCASLRQRASRTPTPTPLAPLPGPPPVAAPAAPLAPTHGAPGPGPVAGLPARQSAHLPAAGAAAAAAAAAHRGLTSGPPATQNHIPATHPASGPGLGHHRHTPIPSASGEHAASHSALPHNVAHHRRPGGATAPHPGLSGSHPDIAMHETHTSRTTLPTTTGDLAPAAPHASPPGHGHTVPSPGFESGAQGLLAPASIPATNDTDSGVLLEFLHLMRARKLEQLAGLQSELAALSADAVAVEQYLMYLAANTRAVKRQRAGTRGGGGGAGHTHNAAAGDATATTVPNTTPAQDMSTTQPTQPPADEGPMEGSGPCRAGSGAAPLSAPAPPAAERAAASVAGPLGTVCVPPANLSHLAPGGAAGAAWCESQQAAAAKWSRIAHKYEALESVFGSCRSGQTPTLTPTTTHTIGGGAAAAAAATRTGPHGPAAAAAATTDPHSSPTRRPHSLTDAGGLPEPLLRFAEDLAAFASSTTLTPLAGLCYGEPPSASCMVAATAWDRDDEFFAVAGIAKRVKLYEARAVLRPSVAPGAHYPLLELCCRSRLSSVTWSSYLKGHLAAADYEGVVQLWDANTNSELTTFEEHRKRVWSIDFSQADPARLLSGGDDGLIKLWTIHTDTSVATLDLRANVCSVQFSPHSPHLLAAGCANYRIYLYDLRHTARPLHVLPGHSRAVSYVRFLSSCQLVSASTDNSLRLWQLDRPGPDGLPACVQTFRGHSNERNFTGLSVMPDGYIACGSENNRVYCYHHRMPMPVASYDFGAPEEEVLLGPSPHHGAGGGGGDSSGAGGGSGALSGTTGPLGFVGGGRAGGGGSGWGGSGQFVSSVSWSRRGNYLLAANSVGLIKLFTLQ